MLPVVQIAVTFLSYENGGRKTVVDLSSGLYMPHLVIQLPEVRSAKVAEGNVIVGNYLGVRFLSGPRELILEQPHNCEIELMYHPRVCYDAVRDGATFTVREGGRMIGFGVVKQRLG